MVHRYKPIDHIAKEQGKEAIYSILCNDCDQEYVDQTKLQFEMRLKEYQKTAFFSKKGKIFFHVKARLPNQSYYCVGKFQTYYH